MEKSNPWFTIWTEPRATIAQVVAKNPNHFLWTLAWIYGFCSLMNMYQSMALGVVYSTASILIAAVLIAPLWGWVMFSLWSLVTYWTGKWFKGKAQYKHVRAAYAWSCVPFIVNIPLWGLMVFLFGHQLFLSYPNTGMVSNALVFVLFAVLIVKVAMSIWSLVIYLNALSEVQQFSIIRSILSVILAALIFAVFFYILWSLLILVVNGSAVAALPY